MATWQFIELATHPDTIINVSQVVAIEKMEVMLSEQKRKAYGTPGTLADLVHAISVSLVGGKTIELVFDSEEMCKATLKMMKIALKPILVKKPTLPSRPEIVADNAPSTSEKPQQLRADKKPRTPRS